MTEKQWNELCGMMAGTRDGSRPLAGFIIDSPWLPNWYGCSILDYLAHDDVWLKANFQAVESFPEAIFLPGFWAEYGMCTEPSAFGTRCMFAENEFPYAHAMIRQVEEVDALVEPNPATDGLLPLVLKRLKWAEPRIREKGHAIRFSVSRGPLNIASFLMGTTEFLMALKTDPDRTHKLLSTITRFLKNWHELQRQTFSTIDGIMMLDDVVGFIGEEDFKEFGLPYLKELYAADVKVKLFHNDAGCESSVRYYPEIGINLFNPGIQQTIGQIHDLTGGRLAVLGSIPPRDVLAKAAPAEVAAAVQQQMREKPTAARVVMSCAGGMPPAVTTENIRAFLDAALAASR